MANKVMLQNAVEQYLALSDEEQQTLITRDYFRDIFQDALAAKEEGDSNG